jgi:hypothetical protein
MPKLVAVGRARKLLEHARCESFVKKLDELVFERRRDETFQLIEAELLSNNGSELQELRAGLRELLEASTYHLTYSLWNVKLTIAVLGESLGRHATLLSEKPDKLRDEERVSRRSQMKSVDKLIGRPFTYGGFDVERDVSWRKAAEEVTLEETLAGELGKHV